jgi:hypothetical protein
MYSSILMQKNSYVEQIQYQNYKIYSELQGLPQA